MQAATKELINQTAKPTKTSSADKKAQADKNTLEYMEGQLDQARAVGDWSSVKRLAGDIGKLERDKAEKEREALMAKVGTIQDQMKVAIETAVDTVMASLTDEESNLVHGVWFSRDFANGDNSIRIRHVLKQTRAKKNKDS